MTDAEKEAKRASVLEHLRKANEAALAFREKYPDSPFTLTAFKVSRLAGCIEAELNSMPLPKVIHRDIEELR